MLKDRPPRLLPMWWWFFHSISPVEGGGGGIVPSLWGGDCLLSLWGGDSFLSWWCRNGLLSLWGRDCLLSRFLSRSPTLRSFLREWLHAGLRPLRWRSASSFLWRRSSFLTTCCCKTSTYSLYISISLSLLEWDGLAMLVADLSSCRWEADFQLLVCESCPWFSLWTSDCKCLSSWTDSSKMLGREKWVSPLWDWFAILFSKTNFWAYCLVEYSHRRR